LYLQIQKPDGVLCGVLLADASSSRRNVMSGTQRKPFSIRFPNEFVPRGRILGVPVAILLKSAMKLHKRRNGIEIGLQNFFALEEIHLEGYC
jgi:hypothetical protein